MKAIASRIPLIVPGIVLLIAMFVLAAGRLEYCGQSEGRCPTFDTAMMAETSSPTPAPPQKVVFVQIESDRPDLEIGWAD